MIRSIASFASAVLFLGCAGTQPALIAPQPRAIVTAVRPLARWIPVVLPARESMLHAADEADGAVDVIAGSIRIQVRHGDAVWGADTTLHPITAHAADGTHWLFATADGALFRADTFTGPLTRVGDTDRRWLTAGFDSTGNVAARADDQVLWIGTSDGSFRTAPPPANGPLVDTGFVDRAFGAAVIAPGRLFRTVDGGATFAPVDTGTAATYVLYPNADQFVLDTTAGLMRLGPSGGLTPYAGSRGDLDHQVSDDVVQNIVSSIWTSDPSARATLIAGGGAMLSDGRIAAVVRDQMVMLDRAGTAVTADLPGEECQLAAHGNQLISQCETDHHVTSFHTFSADRTWTEMRHLEIDSRTVVAPDGSSIVSTGNCDGVSPATRDETAICWYDGSTWRPVSLQGNATPMSVFGDSLLCRIDEPASDDHPRTIRLFTADGRENGRAIELESSGAILLEAGFTSNGLIAGIATDGTRLMSAIGTPSRPLALRPLPQGALRIAFVDGMRGVAAGHHLGEVWTTLDGAQTWTHLELPIEGDPSSVRLTHRPLLGSVPIDEMSCISSACVISSRLVWLAPDLVAPARGRVFAAQHAPAPLDDDELDDPRDQGFRAGSGACEPASHRTSAVLSSERLYGGDGWVELNRTVPISPQGGRFALIWGGRDDRGAFESTARPSLIPSLVTQAGIAGTQVQPGDEGLTIPRLVTRGLVILERCVGPAYSSQCDLLVAARGAVPRLIAMQGNLLAFDQAPVHLRAIIPLSDGGAALHISSSFLSPSLEDRWVGRVDTVVRLDARGEIIARRGYAWTHARTTRMLARSSHGPGLIVATAPNPRDLVFYSMDPNEDGQRVGSLPQAPIAACGNGPASDPNAFEFVADQPSYGASVSFAAGRFILTGPANVRSNIEINAQGAACLRAVSFWSLNPTDERDMLAYTSGVPRFRAVQNQMQAQSIDRRSATTISCTW